MSAKKYLDDLKIIERTDQVFRCKNKGWEPYNMTIPELMEAYHKHMVDRIDPIFVSSDMTQTEEQRFHFEHGILKTKKLLTNKE